MPEANAPVVVIDLQTGMFDGVETAPLHDADALVARVRAVLDWARSTGRPVAFIRHDGGEGDFLRPGHPGWPVWPALGQADDEPTFGKGVGDAFSNPDFQAWIAASGAGEVILLGAQSDECVTATVAGAQAAGLKVTVVSDAHSTWGYGGETAVFKIARCNLAFREAGVTLVESQALAAR